MNKPISDTDLIEFHFGSLNDENRMLVEEALISTPSLLENYFSVKREFEEPDSENLSPSKMVKEKITSELYPSKENDIWASLKSFATPPRLALGGAFAVILSLTVTFSNFNINENETTKLSGVKVDMSNDSSISLDVL